MMPVLLVISAKMASVKLANAPKFSPAKMGYCAKHTAVRDALKIQNVVQSGFARKAHVSRHTARLKSPVAMARSVIKAAASIVWMIRFVARNISAIKAAASTLVLPKSPVAMARSVTKGVVWPVKMMANVPTRNVYAKVAAASTLCAVKRSPVAMARSVTRDAVQHVKMMANVPTLNVYAKVAAASTLCAVKRSPVAMARSVTRDAVWLVKSMQIAAIKHGSANKGSA
jgi:hypothetical protein